MFCMRLGMMINVDPEGQSIYSAGCTVEQLKANLHEHNCVKFGKL